MGLKIVSDDKNIKVIRQDKTSSNGNPYTKYSLMFSQKANDGTWHNKFIDAIFKKGVSLQNKSIIKITNAFPVYSEYNGKETLKIFIMDFEVIQGGETKPVEPPPGDGFMNVPDGIYDELPFN